MAVGTDSGEFVQGMRAACPELCAAVDSLAESWLAPVLRRLADVDEGRDPTLRTKHLNDAIWHTFEIERQEILLLDSPLLQRMRGIKQLGLANLVFPGANHDRFEHTCGVIEAANRMFTALSTNAERRCDENAKKGQQAPSLQSHDRMLVRLAAVMHDVGHGPFSHAIEPVVGARYSAEVKAFNDYVTKGIHLDAKVKIAELISILVVLSPTMGKIFQHNLFRRPENCSIPEFQLCLAVLIMGGRRQGQLACLSAIISGQVDADKLDYMARDAHHAGMPIEFDTERLLRKLETIRCTPDNLPRSQKENIAFAEACPNGHYFDLGIAASGVGALEQMLIGRAFLYDRLYHHHKVRAAEAMAQRLLHYASQERGKPFDLADLYLDVGDDTMIRLLGGELKRNGFEGGGEQSALLAQALLNRELYVRAFAFRASFHTGIPSTSGEEERTAALAEIWDPVSTDLSDFEDRLAAEKDIISIAKKIAPITEDNYLIRLANNLRDAHVIVDLAENRVKPVTINVHAEDGSLDVPNLFFDPARWSHVYNLQKRTGYVFCPREYLPLVTLASKLFFFERWGYAVSDKSDRFTKTLNVLKPDWINRLRAKNMIDELANEVLQRKAIVRTFIREGDISYPEAWKHEAADFESEIVDDLRSLVPQGISPDDKAAIASTVSGLASFINTMHQDKTWITQKGLKEADLQRELARHLRAQGLDVEEGAAVGGGQYDLVIRGRTLIENKISGQVADPFEAKPDAPYQANRYAVAKCMRVFFTLVGYVPKNGADPVEQTKSIRVRKVEGINRTAAEICAVVPFGAPRPSDVSAVTV